MPHWPTATTRRPPCVAALVGIARLRTRAPAPSACRNLRRFIGCNMRCLLPGHLLDGWPRAGDIGKFTLGQGSREVKGPCSLRPKVLYSSHCRALQALYADRLAEAYDYLAYHYVRTDETNWTKCKGRAALSRRRRWQGLPSLAGHN